MKHLGGSRKYMHVFYLRFRENLEFPLDLLATWAGLPFTMITYYFLYGIIFQYNPSFANTTFPVLLVYFFLTLCFRRMGNHSGIANDINDSIQKGNFIAFLARPIHYVGYFFASRSTKAIIQGLMALPFVILVPIFVIPGFAFNGVAYVQAFILAYLGFLVAFQIFYIVGLLTFWFEEIWGFRHMVGTINWLFSGAIIPISILAAPLQLIAFILPFQHQAAIPAQLILGQKTTADFFISAIINSDSCF